jgi:hypothetical protein
MNKVVTLGYPEVKVHIDLINQLTIAIKAEE